MIRRLAEGRTVRSVGVEEELLIVEPGTGRPRALAGAVMRAAAPPPRLVVLGHIDHGAIEVERTDPVAVFKRALVVELRQAVDDEVAADKADVIA